MRQSGWINDSKRMGWKAMGESEEKKENEEVAGGESGH